MEATGGQADPHEDAIGSSHQAFDDPNTGRLHFITAHDEALEHVRAERGAERHVRGVAPAGHHDAADAGNIVAGIEWLPTTPQRDLPPHAQIDPRRPCGDATLPRRVRGHTRRRMSY